MCCSLLLSCGNRCTERYRRSSDSIVNSNPHSDDRNSVVGNVHIWFGSFKIAYQSCSPPYLNVISRNPRRTKLYCLLSYTNIPMWLVVPKFGVKYDWEWQHQSSPKFHPVRIVNRELDCKRTASSETTGTTCTWMKSTCMLGVCSFFPYDGSSCFTFQPRLWRNSFLMSNLQEPSPPAPAPPSFFRIPSPFSIL